MSTEYLVKDKTKQSATGSTYQTENNYNTEISLLKMFIERFSKYVGEVLKANPNDKTRKTDATIRIVNDILNERETKNYTSVDKIKEIYKIIGESSGEKQTKSLYGEGVNGFRLDDVLNPKEELDLKNLLTELGVTE